LKRLFKYPATLLILILVGYTQVFAHAYRVDFEYSPFKQGLEKNHVKGPGAQATGIENVYFEEEENKRDDTSGTDVLCTDLSVFYFESLNSTSGFHEQVSALYFFKSPLFRVLRL
jgi:hypothetical protein